MEELFAYKTNGQYNHAANCLEHGNASADDACRNGDRELFNVTENVTVMAGVNECAVVGGFAVRSFPVAVVSIFGVGVLGRVVLVIWLVTASLLAFGIIVSVGISSILRLGRG
jgi:hypothetical protein